MSNETINKTIEQLRQRGAIEIKDGGGSGFDDEPLTQELPTDLQQQIDEMEDRSKNSKPIPEAIERAQELREENLQLVEKFKFDRQQEVTDYVPGRMMSMAEFLLKLRRIDHTFSYNDFSAAGMRGLTYLKGSERVFLTAVQEGMMIEWSQLRTDEHGIGTSEKYRGYRTVLMNLISGGILTEDQVNEEFGQPTGPRAARWNRNLYMLRNQICRDCGQKLCVCREVGETSRADNYSHQD